MTEELFLRLFYDTDLTLRQFIKKEYNGRYVIIDDDDNDEEYILIPNGKSYTMFILKYGEYI
jgi:hypothetical protein